MTVTSKPKIVIQTRGSCNEPKPTKVDLLATINLPFCKPKKAMNKPIPEEIANFKSAGIESMIFSLNLNKVIKIK